MGVFMKMVQNLLKWWFNSEPFYKRPFKTKQVYTLLKWPFNFEYFDKWQLRNWCILSLNGHFKCLSNVFFSNFGVLTASHLAGGISDPHRLGPSGRSVAWTGTVVLGWGWRFGAQTLGWICGGKPMGKRQLLWFRDVSNEVWTGFFLPETCQVCTKLGLDPGSVILSRRTLQFWGRVVHCPRSPKAVSAGLFGRWESGAAAGGLRKPQIDLSIFEYSPIFTIHFFNHFPMVLVLINQPILTT